jgi:hypothetical protein
LTPDQKIKRANEAQALFTNEAYREAWSSLEADLIGQWAGTIPTDSQNRERYYHQLTGLKAVKTRLERWIAEGREAARDIERTKKRGNRAGPV